MLVRIGAANYPQNGMIIVSFYGFWTDLTWETMDFHRAEGEYLRPSELMWKPVVKKVPLFEKHPVFVAGIRQLYQLDLGKSRGNPMGNGPKKSANFVQMSYFLKCFFFFYGVFFNHVFFFNPYFSILSRSDIFFGMMMSHQWIFGGTKKGFSPRSPAGAAQRCQATFADGLCVGGAACGGCETRKKKRSGVVWIFFLGESWVDTLW